MLAGHRENLAAGHHEARLARALQLDIADKHAVATAFAGIAAAYDARAGRQWKNLQDTTNDPISANRRAQPWASWQRSEDYYSEGLLIWLDADTLIRERTGNRRSLDPL